MLTKKEFKIKYKGMGLFVTDKNWIHPEKTEVTHEIIYVVKGNVFIKEESKEHSLSAGDMIILKPDTPHNGYKTSTGETSFYWVHFYDGRKKKEPPVPEGIQKFPDSWIFRELLHYSNLPDCPYYMTDCLLLYLLCKAAAEHSENLFTSRLPAEIYEWIRINANAKLTAERASEHFKYNSEYISRLLNKNYGTGFNGIKNRFLLSEARNLLCNSALSVKEIANVLKFSDPTAFINFFKYHENTTPTRFRNSYYETHMNLK